MTLRMCAIVKRLLPFFHSCVQYRREVVLVIGRHYEYDSDAKVLLSGALMPFSPLTQPTCPLHCASGVCVGLFKIYVESGVI